MRVSRVAQIVVVSSAFVLGCARPHFPGYIIEPYEPETTPGAELSLPIPDSSTTGSACSRVLALEIRKSERALVARCENGESVRLRTALGREPVGPKQRQGDMRTPEGTYRIAGPPRSSRFHIFVPIDYPSEQDADRAHEAGLISKAERDEIVAAWTASRMPPQYTRLGGHLGLHGEGERWQGDSQNGLNWTQGCVAMSDADIEFLAARIEPGTPVTILP